MPYSQGSIKGLAVACPERRTMTQSYVSASCSQLLRIVPAEIICGILQTSRTALLGRQTCRYLRDIVYACGTESDPLCLYLSDNVVTDDDIAAMAMFVAKFTKHVLVVDESVRLENVPGINVYPLTIKEVIDAGEYESPDTLTNIIDGIADSNMPLPTSNLVNTLVQLIISRAERYGSDEIPDIPQSSVLSMASRLMHYQTYNESMIHLLAQFPDFPMLHIPHLGRFVHQCLQYQTRCDRVGLVRSDITSIVFSMVGQGLLREVWSSIITPLVHDMLSSDRTTSLLALTSLQTICACYRAMSPAMPVLVNLICGGSNEHKILATSISLATLTFVHSEIQASQADGVADVELLGSEMCRVFLSSGFLVHVRQFLRASNTLDGDASVLLRNSLRIYELLLVLGADYASGNFRLDSGNAEADVNLECAPSVQRIAFGIAGFRHKIFGEIGHNVLFLVNIIGKLLLRTNVCFPHLSVSERSIALKLSICVFSHIQQNMCAISYPVRATVCSRLAEYGLLSFIASTVAEHTYCLQLTPSCKSSVTPAIKVLALFLDLAADVRIPDDDNIQRGLQDVVSNIQAMECPTSRVYLKRIAKQYAKIVCLRPCSGTNMSFG